MSDKALYLAIQKRASAARVSAFSPHDFRRTFVGDLLDSGADLATAQQLAGHASPTTTARYGRRGERTKREAAGRLAVPFTGRPQTWYEPVSL
jgi:integrase